MRFAWFRKFLSKIGAALTPAPGFWPGAAWAMLALALLLLAVQVGEILWVPAPNPGLLAVVLALLAAAALAGLLVVLFAWLLARVPRRTLWAFGAGVLVLAFLFGSGLPEMAALALVAGVALAALLFGGGLGTLLASRGALTGVRRWVTWVSLALGAGLLGLALVYLVAPGASPALPVEENARRAEMAALDLPDPAQPGSFAVKTLTYGSGDDRRRLEYAAGVGLTTPRVDGSALIDGWNGLTGWLRTAYWGFDARALPLNAQVWYPAGDGPFPLVLIVHGNHPMEDYSEAGYAYLGELLASRGMIVASVDENFLNFTFVDALDLENPGLGGENDARAWLLLEHLKLWRAWNAQAGNPFTGKVDLQRIALIGHSRGGEAVATAAVFNRLPYDPDNARLRFDYDFAIRAVVAIAPVDGQYRPGGRSAALQDVDYLTLQGAQDADVRSMSGARAYERVRFSGDAFHFKAAVYLAGANHGQFNASWGAADITGWPARLLNRSALLAEQDQQRVAQAAISAFLDASLNGNTGYLGLFRNPLAGAAWLPDALLVTQYQDSTFIPVADFEEDLDLTTASLPGAALSGEGLDSWREQVVSLRSGSRETSAVSLRWKRAEGEPEPLYRLRLPAGVLELDGTAQLSFTLADTRELPGAGEALLPALQASLELVDRAGNAARLPLDQAAPLRSPISTAVMKASFLDRYVDAEPIYQTFVFPLQAFAAANPQLEIASLAEIRFIFASPKGELLLDHLGFSAPAP